MRMKYVMLQDEDDSLYPIIFPDTLAHKDFEDVPIMSHLEGWSKLKGRAKIVSAGTVTLPSGICSGESESLKLQSALSRDTAVMQKFLS